MFIRYIEYAQWENEPYSWRLEDCTLDNINLIVGKNASGKTMALNIAGNLGHLLAGERKPFTSGNYKLVEFEKDSSEIKYILHCEMGKVVSESLDIGAENRLERGMDGSGLIYYQEEQRKIRFQAPENEVAAFARRDTIQHPFLEDLYDWGKSVRHYYFGKTLGQDHLAVFLKAQEKETERIIDPKDINSVVTIFKSGRDQFGESFLDPIISDMREVGYDLNDIGIAPMKGVTIEGPVPAGEVFGMYAKESDLNDVTNQKDMSQGMFRALSLITQLTYSQMMGKPLCILVDDIGEGLDYDRSSALIRLLIRKVENSSSQLIMTTNDRFVMNNVPLRFWSIVHRTGNVCRMFNYRNARKMFEAFEVTGLSNFDLFSSEFFLKDFGEN